MQSLDLEITIPILSY